MNECRHFIARVVIHGHADDFEPLTLIPAVKVDKPGHLHPARCAPGSPEVQQHHLAAIVRKLDAAPIQRIEQKCRRRLARRGVLYMGRCSRSGSLRGAAAGPVENPCSDGCQDSDGCKTKCQMTLWNSGHKTSSAARRTKGMSFSHELIVVKRCVKTRAPTTIIKAPLTTSTLRKWGRILPYAARNRLTPREVARNGSAKPKE